MQFVSTGVYSNSPELWFSVPLEVAVFSWQARRLPYNPDEMRKELRGRNCDLLRAGTRLSHLGFGGLLLEGLGVGLQEKTASL